MPEIEQGDGRGRPQGLCVGSEVRLAPMWPVWGIIFMVIFMAGALPSAPGAGHQGTQQQQRLGVNQALKSISGESLGGSAV